MTTSPHTLEEKIGEYVGIAVTDGSKGGLAVRKLLALIKTVGEKLIENGESNIGYRDDILVSDNLIRNDFRASQRQALEDIISGRKGL